MPQMWQTEDYLLSRVPGSRRYPESGGFVKTVNINGKLNLLNFLI
jgi:hypothetical protein